MKMLKATQLTLVIIVILSLIGCGTKKAVDTGGIPYIATFSLGSVSVI